MNLAKRNPAADIIRILALFSVVSVHFFLKTGFYSYPIVGKRMFLMTVIRSFFMVCVPLFLTLSGYLLRRKRLEKAYYGRVGKIILTYVLASLLCVVFSVVSLEKEMTAKKIVLGILNFTAAPYSWYIEMYLGLFLLIPFLNIVYNSLPSQKSKIWLVITFAVLTALPSVLNIYNLDLPGWWAQPSLTTDRTKLVPEYWQSFYPITYYFVGCYLGEYGLKIKKSVNVLLIVLLTGLIGAYCYWRSDGTYFVGGSWSNYQALAYVILTVLVFAFFMNTNYDKMPNWLTKILQKISGLCLGGYLVSWIFDEELYPWLLKKVPHVPYRLKYYVIIVPVIFVLSLVASFVLSKVQLVIEKVFSWLCGMVKKAFVKKVKTP